MTYNSKVFARIQLSEAVQSIVWIDFSFNRKVTKEIPHVLVTGVKTSLFAKIPAALLLLKKLAENFLTLIARFLLASIQQNVSLSRSGPTHYAMCGLRKIQMMF